MPDVALPPDWRRRVLRQCFTTMQPDERLEQLRRILVTARRGGSAMPDGIAALEAEVAEQETVVAAWKARS